MVEGVPLPPPEQLKHKILIKDKKVRRGAAGSSTTSLSGTNAGTLPRGTHLTPVPEEMESKGEETAAQNNEVGAEISEWLCGCMYSVCACSENER